MKDYRKVPKEKIISKQVEGTKLKKTLAIYYINPDSINIYKLLQLYKLLQ